MYGDNTRAMWSYLTQDMGYNPVHAAGILANVGAESSFNPAAENKAEGAFGSFQHRGPRLASLQSFASDRNLPVDDWKTQFDFMGHEMGGPEAAAMKALQAAQNPADAARVFDAKFERSAGLTREQRAKQAVDIYNTFAGGEFGGDGFQYKAPPQASIMDQPDPTIAAAPPVVQQPDNSIMGPMAAPPPEKDPSITMDINSGLSSLGQSLMSLGMGQVPDLQTIGQQFYQRREKLREEAEAKKKQAAIAQALKNFPGGEEVAQLVAEGVPVGEALQMIQQEKGFKHQEKMQLNDFGFRKGESALDRKQQAELAEAGFAIDYERIDQQSRQFALSHELDRDQFTESAAQFAKTHGLNEQEFAQRADQFAQTFGLDKERLGQNASQFAKTHGLDEKRFTEHVKQFEKTHSLNADQFANEQMRWAEEMSYKKMSYERDAANEKARGPAGQEVIASTFEALGDQDTADFIRSRDPAAFNDPAMVNQFLQAADTIKPKDTMTTDMKNFLAAQNNKEFADHLEKQAPGGTPEYTKSFYKVIDKREEDLGKSRDVLAAAEHMRTIVNMSETEFGDELRTGRLASMFQPVAELIRDMGLGTPDFNKVTSYKEMIDMVHNDIFPKLRAVGSGSTSDWEGRIMSSAFPGLANSPHALKAQLNFYINRVERNVAENQYLRSRADNGAKMSEAEAEWKQMVKDGDPRTVPAMYSDEMKPEHFVAGFKSGAVKPGDFVDIDGKLHMVTPEMVEAILREEN